VRTYCAGKGARSAARHAGPVHPRQDAAVLLAEDARVPGTRFEQASVDSREVR
jgi:hypothetical protein